MKKVILNAILVALLYSVSFSMDSTIELKYASPYPPTHPYSVADQLWIERVESETNGRVRIKPYWGGTLISLREATQELAAGLADIAFIAPMYERTGFTLTKILLDFFAGGEPEKNIKVYFEIFERYAPLRNEFKDIKILAVCAGYPMHLMTAKRPVEKLLDIVGMRLRITGDIMTATVKALGAEPVSMPVVETYEALSKGILDGAIFGGADYKVLNMADVVRYATINFKQYRGVYPSRAINKKVWDNLPSEIKSVFEKHIDFWSYESLRQMYKEEEEGLRIAKEKGIRFVTMAEQDVKKYEATFESKLLEKLKKLDEEGYPASTIYYEIRKYLSG